MTGANSAVGTRLLTRLLESGRGDIRVVAGVRRQQAVDDLPQAAGMTPALIDYDDPDSLIAALQDVECVVHLAGILFESKTTDYQTANVGTTRALIRAAQSTSVRHVVFISSLGADPRSPNGYFRSKGEAEQVVADSGIDATIIRTPLLLGPDTAGGRALLRSASQGTVRVLGGGAHRLRPLDIDDLCAAIAGCGERPVCGVRTLDLVGPTTLSYRDLLHQTAVRLGRQVAVKSTPVWLARLGAAVVGLTRTGGMTPTVIDVITSDEEVAQNADADLGIRLTPLSDTLAKLEDPAP
ncbi:MAG: NAD(P)H-binding protein [Acidobacteria bacterium]|nr:NAD(P)H-binding protein [Acidobacteriota bacterium]